MSADPIAHLVRLLARLPGVGERTATRLTHYILAAEDEYARALGAALVELHELVRPCVVCGNYSTEERCAICRDPQRQNGVICVVARVPDLEAIERSGSFRGRYHVLHRLLSPLDGVGPEELQLEGLVARIKAEGIVEVVIATPLSVDGEATALYLAKTLASPGLKVSRIASGIPHGGELEFADQVTMGRAFHGRRDLS